MVRFRGSAIAIAIASTIFLVCASPPYYAFAPRPCVSAALRKRKASSSSSILRVSSTDASTRATCSALGGDLRRISMGGEGDGFLARMSVPTYAASPATTSGGGPPGEDDVPSAPPASARRGLEAIVPGAFVVRGALPVADCEAIIRTCEDRLGFGRFRAGKNNHGALQILVTNEVAGRLSREIGPHVNLNALSDLPSNEEADNAEDDDVRYTIAGLNKRWRVYRYATDGEENFAPHIDAGFPPSDLSDDGTQLVWDATPENEDIVSRFTVLIYLNDDFRGGQTNFYVPLAEQEEGDALELLACVKPRAGSVLVFPQAVTEDAVEHARRYWPLHEGSAVTGGNRPKYVIRSDLLVAKTHGLADEERGDPMFAYDGLVRRAFLPRSPAFSKYFKSQLESLYNPHMGVENVGPLLYSLVRFAKSRRIVEIGAGYTSLWLLRALKDNDDEMQNISNLQAEGKCRLLDYPWSIPEYVDRYDKAGIRSSLLCIDNCLHQRETATGAAAVARSLGLDDYLEFVRGDAYDIQFEPESVDLLWCDFGVGARMGEFARGALDSVRPGGLLVCHSTLTNCGTRAWLEGVRAGADEGSTGIPPGEFSELSLLEPHKRYQNSVTILQRRRSRRSGSVFKEPLYSEYA